MTAALYVAFDKVANTVTAPVMIHAHDQSAVRTFRDMIKNPDNYISHHPGDFVLMKLATIDTETGDITHTDHNGPMIVITGEQIIAATQEK